jgi:type VI protein secretion system component VasK
MRDLASAALAAGRMHGARIAILGLLVVVVILVAGWVIYAARRRRREKP